MTQNRRLELMDAVSHPKKANSYDELAELLPAWEKKVRELEKFTQSALSNDHSASSIGLQGPEVVVVPRATGPVSRIDLNRADQHPASLAPGPKCQANVPRVLS